MLKPRRAFEFPSLWNCVAIEQRTQIFANEQIFEIKYKINLSINVSEPDLNPSTNFGFGQNLFPVKRPQICLSFKCFSRSSYSTFSVILSFPLQFWQKLDNISPIALPDLTVIYIFAIIFQQIHILLYHCMIIVTSYMFSSRCIFHWNTLWICYIWSMDWVVCTLTKRSLGEALLFLEPV